MNYLLDTHYILWTLFEPEKIPAKIVKIFENEEDEKYVSGISLWEISLKYSIGKLELYGTNPEGVYESILETGFKILDLKTIDLATFFRLPLQEDHKDPFDRFLIWQAIQNNLIFLTKDKKIEQYRKMGLQL